MGLLFVRKVRRFGHSHRHAVQSAQVKEGLDVLRKTRAAVPGTRVEKALPDPRIAAHSEPDGVHVGARGVAETRELVHEGHAHRQHRVRGVLRQLARARIGDDHALAGELQRRVKRAKHLACALAPRAEDDPVGPEEVLNCGAFLEKLGV